MYYVYRKKCYSDPPKGTRIKRIVRDKESGDSYAVLKPKRVPFFLYVLLFCAAFLAIRATMYEEGSVLHVVIPSEVVSFSDSYAYLGLLVQQENTEELTCDILRDDGVYLVKGLVLQPGAVVGQVLFEEKLAEGAEIYTVIFRSETVEARKKITIIYKK